MNTDQNTAEMLTLMAWAFSCSVGRLRQTPRVENILKVPRFFCAYISSFLMVLYFKVCINTNCNLIMKKCLLLSFLLMVSVEMFAQDHYDEGVNVNGTIWATRNMEGSPFYQSGITFASAPDDAGEWFVNPYDSSYANGDKWIDLHCQESGNYQR